MRSAVLRGFPTLRRYMVISEGEATTQEHTPFHGKHPWARKVVTLGFMGTYSDGGAEIDAVALVGKQSVWFKSILGLLVEG
jgi:hypothetical protein